MKKQAVILLLFTIYFFLAASLTFAARNIVISSDKNSLSLDQELVISASASGFTNGEKIYVKGAFFKDGSSNYFGVTKNNDSWIKNSTTALNQREIIPGVWDNVVIVKPDYSDNGFTGAGEYKFKLGFYYLTSAGNTSSVNWSSNDLNITINSVPTNIPTVKTNSTSSITKTSSSSNSKSPTPTKLASGTSIANYPASTQIKKTNQEFDKITHKVRSASEFAKIKPVTREGNKKEVKVLGAKESNFAPILFISGFLFIMAAISMFVLKILRERKF